MWKNRLFFQIGAFGLSQSLLLLLPTLVALGEQNDRAAGAFLSAIFVGLLLGGGFFIGFRGSKPSRTPVLTILLPLSALAVMGLVAGLPFYFFTPEEGLVPAIFESISYLTTNGASAYPDGEYGRSFDLWRIILAWQGGFMAICFALSLLTAVNSGGVQLHRSPLPYGNSKEGYTRLISTARSLFPLYSVLTIVFTILFTLFDDVTLFDGLSLAVSGISTTALVHIPQYFFNNDALKFVLVLAMLIGASNWDMLQALFMGRRRSLIRDPEIKPAMILFVSAVVLILFIIPAVTTSNFVDIIFIVISAMSTTGYGAGLEGSILESSQTFSSPHNNALGMIILVLVLVGGMSASTSGGLKQLRFVTGYELCREELRRLAHPHGTSIMKIGTSKITGGDANAFWLLLGGFLGALTFGALLLSISGIPFHDALALAFSSLTLSGPASDLIGTGNTAYTALTSFEYMVLILLLITGRIESTFLLALIARSFWNK